MSKRSCSSPVSSSHRVGSDAPHLRQPSWLPWPFLRWLCCDPAVKWGWGGVPWDVMASSWGAMGCALPCGTCQISQTQNGTLKCFATQTRVQHVLFPTSVSFPYSVALCQSLLLVRRTKALPVVPWAHLLPAMLAPVSLGCHEFLLNCQPFPNILLPGRCRPHSGHTAPCNAVLWSLPAPNSLATLTELWGQLPPV